MTTSRYRQLDESKIIATLTALRDRIDNQFPDSGLGRVADEMIAVGSEVAECAAYLNKPNWPIRIFAGLLITSMIIVLYLASPPIDLPEGAHKFSDVQSIAAGLNIVAIVSVAVLFLLRLETNLKRRRAHGVLHELRSLAHVVDMHQLSKDPAGRRLPEPEITESPKGAMSPPSLGRYLDYCTDLLSLTGKLSALLVQRFKDQDVLSEVNEIEALTSALSGRIWQKIQLLESALG
ncbi:MAG: hypothetical protein QOD47_2065 [Gemmatimonadaceae bacterium]|nr:hypothetical protein [Gemmatimonadaceae bacterium]